MTQKSPEFSAKVLRQQATVEIEGYAAGTYPTARCVFVVQDGPDKGERFVFDKKIIRVGSDFLNDVVLQDPTVSRRHAELTLEGSACRLVDLTSTNGTFVDDMRVGEIFIEDGATITFGKTPVSFSVELEEAELGECEANRFGEIVGQSQGMRQIFSALEKVAPANLHVVITGETGTGKEVFARAIHKHSRRAQGPMVIFDCSAFPSSLLESELFGHEAGAFSGATQQRKGVFELADGGTLFLDELGEMSVELQPKLLRAIENGVFRRVGGQESLRVDVRVLAATNREIEARIEEGTFRRDLYYRLAQVRLHLPPLRERLDDIPLLVEHFVTQTIADYPVGMTRPTFTQQALDVLMSYEWPGNVRELRNLVERVTMLSDDHRITASQIRAELGTLGDAHAGESGVHLAIDFQDEAGATLPLREAKDQLVSDFERRYLEKLLQKHEQNISAAAREAKIDRRHFYRLLKKYDLNQ